jgi:hypothetical protein
MLNVHVLYVTTNERADFKVTGGHSTVITRRLASRTGIHHQKQEQQLYLCTQFVQEIVPLAALARLLQIWNNQLKTTRIQQMFLFTDESFFIRAQITDIHKKHVWTDKNSDDIRSH